MSLSIKGHVGEAQKAGDVKPSKAQRRSLLIAFEPRIPRKYILDKEEVGHTGRVQTVACPMF